MEVILWNNAKTRKLIHIESRNLDLDFNEESRIPDKKYINRKKCNQNSKSSAKQLGKIVINAERDEFGKVNYEVELIDYEKEPKQSKNERNSETFKNFGSFFKILKKERVFDNANLEEHFNVENVEIFSYARSKHVQNEINSNANKILNKRKNFGIILENENLKKLKRHKKQRKEAISKDEKLENPLPKGKTKRVQNNRNFFINDKLKNLTGNLICLC